MLNSSTINISKLSIEEYNPDTQTKNWKHLSQLNPKTDYKLLLNVNNDTIIFQIAESTNIKKLLFNLRVNFEKNSEGLNVVAPTALRMIVKSPILALRYNVKDSKNNKIVLKKAQFSIQSTEDFSSVMNLMTHIGVSLKDSKNNDFVFKEKKEELKANNDISFNNDENLMLESQVTFSNVSNAPINSPEQKLNSQQQNSYWNSGCYEEIEYGHNNKKVRNMHPISENIVDLTDSNIDKIQYMESTPKKNSYNWEDKNINNPIQINESTNIPIHHSQINQQEFKNTQNSFHYQNNIKNNAQHLNNLQQYTNNKIIQNANGPEYYSAYNKVSNKITNNNNINPNQNFSHQNIISNQEYGPNSNVRNYNIPDQQINEERFYENNIPYNQIVQYVNPQRRQSFYGSYNKNLNCGTFPENHNQISNSRRNSVYVPCVPSVDIDSSFHMQESQVMVKEDIESLMTTVLKKVLPEIAKTNNYKEDVDKQESSASVNKKLIKEKSLTSLEEEPENKKQKVQENEITEKKIISTVFPIIKPNSITTNTTLSANFFLSLDDETKFGVLKNINFIEGIQLFYACDENTKVKLIESINNYSSEGHKLKNGLFGENCNKPNKKENLAKEPIENKSLDLLERLEKLTKYFERKESTENLGTNAKPQKKTKKIEPSNKKETPVGSQPLKELELWNPPKEKEDECVIVGDKKLRRASIISYKSKLQKWADDQDDFAPPEKKQKTTNTKVKSKSTFKSAKVDLSTNKLQKGKNENHVAKNSNIRKTNAKTKTVKAPSLAQTGIEANAINNIKETEEKILKNKNEDSLSNTTQITSISQENMENLGISSTKINESQDLTMTTSNKINFFQSGEEKPLENSNSYQDIENSIFDKTKKQLKKFTYSQIK
ncbi:hypothetical protein ACO0SA_001272 [Hanseniaspora valbyensis]